MPTWMQVEVAGVHHWHAGLFSLSVRHPGFVFKAGQFARIALPDAANEPLARAYSMVNAPGADTLEFIIAKVPGGELTPRLQRLQKGDDILLNSHPSGFFSLDHVPDGEALWMFATGTGIGPYLSLLKTSDLWQRFSQVQLVHGVRAAADLCYREDLQALQRQREGVFQYQPVVSRERHADPLYLHGRIPALISSGELEQRLGAVLNPSVQVMLCGNPAMIQDARTALQGKGLKKHLKRNPGQITMEQYWAD